MSWLYILSVFIHILCAIIWLGGILFLTLVMVPILRKTKDRRQVLNVLISTGQRFKVIGWHVLLLLLATGLVNIYYRGWFEAGTAFWTSPSGMLLSWKIILFVIVLTLSGLHDFWLGPKAARLMEEHPGTPRTQRARRYATLIGRTNLLLGLAIVLMAIMMIRGIPS